MLFRSQLLLTLKPYKDSRILLKPGVVDEVNESIRQELLLGLTSNVVIKVIESNHKILQDLLLDHQAITKAVVENLAKNGITKGVKNKAKQLLNSKRFKQL